MNEENTPAIDPRAAMRRRRFQLFVSLLLTVFALGLLAQFVDMRAVGRTLREISPGMFVLAVIAMAISVVIASLRYQDIQAKLSKVRPPLVELIKINLLSNFSANFLPVSAAADGIRILAARRHLVIPTWEAIEGVVHDRIMAALGLTLCLIVTLPMQFRLGVANEYVVPQLLFALGLPIALVMLIRVAGWTNLPAWATTAIRPLNRFGDHFGSANAIFRQLGFALAGTVSFALMMLALASGMGAHLSLVTVLSFAPAIYLAQVIPFFYSGFGIREAVSLALLAGSATTGSEIAMSLSLAIGICNLLVSIPGALVAARYGSTTR